jgi:hypothetical protein
MREKPKSMLEEAAELLRQASPLVTVGVSDSKLADRIRAWLAKHNNV